MIAPMNPLTRFIAPVVTLAALAVIATPAAASSFDPRECATARFDLGFDRLSGRDTGFPKAHEPYVETESDGYIAYSDGSVADYDDLPARGWTLVRESIGLVGTEPILDADFQEIGERGFQHRYASYERIDPTLAVAGLAIHERARVAGMRRLWVASRGKVLAHSRARDDDNRRWLMRRGRAFVSSARATEVRLTDAIAAPDDLTVLHAATAQVDRFEDAVFEFSLKMPLASLTTCYR